MGVAFSTSLLVNKLTGYLSQLTVLLLIGVTQLTDAVKSPFLLMKLTESSLLQNVCMVKL